MERLNAVFMDNLKYYLDLRGKSQIDLSHLLRQYIHGALSLRGRVFRWFFNGLLRLFAIAFL